MPDYLGDSQRKVNTNQDDEKISGIGFTVEQKGFLCVGLKYVLSGKFTLFWYLKGLNEVMWIKKISSSEV